MSLGRLLVVRKGDRFPAARPVRRRSGASRR